MVWVLYAGVAGFCLWHVFRIIRNRREDAIWRVLDEAEALIAAGRHREALAQAEEACTQARRACGPNSAMLCHALNLTAVHHRLHGDPERSETLFRELLEIDRRTHREGDVNHAVTLENLAALHVDQGRLKEGEQLFCRAQIIYKTHEGESSKGYRETAAKIADLQKRQLAPHKPASLPDDEIRFLNTMMADLSAEGDDEEALDAGRQAEQLTRSRYGEDHPLMSLTLANIGALHHGRKRFAEAIPFFLRVSQIHRRTLPASDPSLARSLNNLGVAYKDLGSFDKAETTLREALAISQIHRLKNPAGYTEVLENLVHLAHKKGDLAAEASLLQELLEDRRQTLGEANPEYAHIANNLGFILTELGKHADAEPLIRQSLEVNRRQLGDQHPHVRQATINLAELYESTAKPARAIPLYNQLLIMIENVEGKDHPQYASFLDRLGKLHYKLGSYPEAESAWKQLLEIKGRKKDAESEVGAVLTNLSSTYLAAGRYKEAESACRQALELFRQTSGEDSTEFAAGLNTLSGILLQTGRLQESVVVSRRSLDILRARVGERDGRYAFGLNNLAEIHLMMGDFDQAEPLYRQSLEIRRATVGERHPDYANALANLALLHGTMRNFQTALPLCQRALEIRRDCLGEGHPDFTVSLNNFVLLLQANGEFEAALPLAQKVVNLTRQQLGEHHPWYATSLDNLASLHLRASRPADALVFSKQALEVTRALLGEEHPDFALRLNNLAQVQVASSDFEAAHAGLRQSLKVLKTSLGEDHPRTASVMENLAMLYAATNRPAESLSLLRKVHWAEDRMVGFLSAMTSENHRSAAFHLVKTRLYILLSLVLQQMSESTEAVRDALDLVLRRKALLAEALAARRDAVLGGRYPALASKLADLTARRRQIASKTLEGPGREETQTHREQLTQWAAEAQQLEAELARQIPEMNLTRKLQQADRRAVALAIHEDSCLIEFVRFNVRDFKSRDEQPWQPARYLAFVLLAGKPDQVQMIDLGEAAPIDRMIVDFRASITGEGETRAGRDLGAAPLEHVPGSSHGPALRAVVFDKLVPALAGCKRLLLAPDGDLSRLPFEVLPTGDGRRLIDEYTVSYMSCGRDVLSFGATFNRPPTEPLVAADPDFDLGNDGSRVADADIPQITHGRNSRDLDRGLRFGQLPGTRTEGERIAALLGVKPWMDATALESRLKACRSPRILHLATHGFFLADQKRDPNKDFRDLGTLPNQESGGMGRLSGYGLENPLLRSGLALAGANTWLQNGNPPADAEDGLLTAEDVSGLDLLDTDLVVLSACETGLGEIHVGEGVFGLRRAFVLAGAKTLIMSLWKVPDQQTQELMEDFYYRLLEGQPRAEALRQAQLALKACYPNPLYWGAFICQGDPAPLSGYPKLPNKSSQVASKQLWYYSLDGKSVYGPITSAQLKELIRAGKLHRTDKVSPDGDKWHTASKLKGIEWPE